MRDPVSGLVPSTDEMVRWIEAICAQGVRRPGSSADVWTEAFVVERFNEFGLDDVHLEPVVLPMWEPRTWSLAVWNDDERIDVECFPLPHSAPVPDGIEALIGNSAGEIALETVTLTEFPQSFVRDRLALESHDPSGEFDTLVQTLPFGLKLGLVMEPAIEAGAAGFIGVFDAPWESCDYSSRTTGSLGRSPACG